MSYAINDTLSKKPIDGGIEITDAEYKAAMDAKLQGRKAYVYEGALLIESETQRTIYSTANGRKLRVADNAPLPDGYCETARPSKYHYWDDAGGTWVFDASRLDELQSNAGQTIDEKAGEVRGRFISPGLLIVDEYKRAEIAARDFAAAGYPSADVPVAVQAWADSAGMTAKQAADDIIARAEQLYNALDVVRAKRLAGKAAVDNAADYDGVIVARDQAVADLDTVAPGALGS